MNRRGFLASLLAAAPAMVLDPERLLWVPGQRTFFLPSSNTLLTRDLISREALRLFEQNLLVARILDPCFTGVGFKVGDRITIRRPARYAQHEGRRCA